MPCATVHLLLAGRVLQDWTATPAIAPVPVGRPEVRDAFLHGALAPDVGFMPGADRFVSELAHYAAPADLARALFERAGNPEDEAFAWGWATHVLGDVAIHPLVGRGVGEYLHGDRSVRIDAAEDVEAHVSLEVGLDIHCLHSDPRIPAPPRSPRLDSARIAHLAEALTRVYGLTWDRAEMLRQHRQAVRWTRLWPGVLRFVASGRAEFPVSGGSGMRTGPRALGLGGGQVLRRLPRRGTPARGLLHPRRPPDWLLEEVDEVAARFPERFRTLVRGGLGTLENRNLETGDLAGWGRGHPASDRVARRLASARRGTPGSLAPELRGILPTVSDPGRSIGGSGPPQRAGIDFNELPKYEREEGYG